MYGIWCVSLFIISFFFIFFYFALLQIFGIPGPIRSSAPSSAWRVGLSLDHRVHLWSRYKLLSHRRQRSLILRARRHQNICHATSPSDVPLAKHSSILRTILTGENLYSTDVPMEVSTSSLSQHGPTSFRSALLVLHSIPFNTGECSKILENSKILEKLRVTRPSRPESVVALGFRF